MSIAAMLWAYEQTIEGPSGKKFLLVTLGDHADENDECYPGQDLLAHRTSQGVSTVQAHLKALEEEGFITRTPRYRANGKRNSDRYKLHRQNSKVVADTTSEFQDALPLNAGGEPSENRTLSNPPSFPPKGKNKNNEDIERTSPGAIIAEFIDDQLILNTGAGLSDRRSRVKRQFDALVEVKPKPEVDHAIWKFIELYPRWMNVTADAAWQAAKRDAHAHA